MLPKIHRGLTYFLASIFALIFLFFLVLSILFLLGVQSSLDLLFIPFTLLDSFPYIYVVPAIILLVAAPLAVIKRKPSTIVTSVSGVIFIVAAVIYYLYAGSESATTQLIGLAGSAFAYSLAMILTIIGALIMIPTQNKK